MVQTAEPPGQGIHIAITKQKLNLRAELLADGYIAIVHLDLDRSYAASYVNVARV